MTTASKGEPTPIPRKLSSPFTLKELLTGRDALWAIFLTACFCLAWIAVGRSGLLSTSNYTASTSEIAGTLFTAALVVSAAMLGLVLAAVAVMVSFSDPRYLAKVYAYDPEELRKYLEVLFFPAKLAALTLILAIFVNEVVTFASTVTLVVVASSSVLLFFTIWELTSVLEAIRQIRGLITTGARKYDLKRAEVGPAKCEGEPPQRA